MDELQSYRYWGRGTDCADSWLLLLVKSHWKVLKGRELTYVFKEPLWTQGGKRGNQLGGY